MKMSSLNRIARHCIEFSSLILLLVVLLLMHGMGDATFAKQIKIDSVNEEKLHFDPVEKEAFENDDSLGLSEDILRFSPDSIDFGKSEIGKPVIETVQIHNVHDEKTIQMISVTGASPFYCSFVEKKLLAPRSNTTITVAFLARQEGLVNNTLLVHSNVGLSRLKLYGYGEPSQFRVRPLIGGRVSLNSTYSSVIYLYNPFPTSIQLTEVYSSGANLQLELLNQEMKDGDSVDKSVGYWNIPPYEYRAVMKTNFAGKIVSNYTSFIRIHLNSSVETQLVLPVEIEVCSEPGLYSTTNILDFGMIIPNHLISTDFVSLEIKVFNTDTRNITVVGIEFEPGHVYDGLEIKFDGPISVPPNPSKAVVLGWLYMAGNQSIACTGICGGKVIIKAQESDVKHLELAYVMRIVDGQLYFPQLQTAFVNDPLESVPSVPSRSLTIVNMFDFPIVINKIVPLSPFSFEESSNFLSDKNVVLQPGEEYLFGTVRLALQSKNSANEGASTMIVKTNLTDIVFRLRYHVNCLHVFVPGVTGPLKERWDIGVISSSVSMTTHFALANYQSTPLMLNTCFSTNNNITCEYLGTFSSFQMSPSAFINKVDQVLDLITSNSTPTGASFEHAIEARHFGVFQVHIKSSIVGKQLPQIVIPTDSGDINLPLKFVVNDGKIVANKVVLTKTFPGRVVSSPIIIKSYHSFPVRIKRISLETNDKRFKVDVPPGYVIQPGENSDVKVTFDPSAICPPLVCYASLDIEKEVGHFWLLGHGVYSDTAYIDKELYKLVRNQWMTHSELDFAPTASFRFHTDGFGSFHSEVQAQLHWPRLSNKFALKFPALRIGRKLVKDIVIENPADKPIIVQAVHIANYPNADVLIQMMQSIVFHKQWASADMESIEKTILDSHNLAAFGFAPSSAQGSKSSDTNRVHEWLGVRPSVDSFTMLLAPGARQRLGVVFRPLVERNFTSLLILRNNLTVIEVVVLRGEGGSGLLKIDQSNSKGTDDSLTDDTKSDYMLSGSKIFFEFPHRALDKLCPGSGEVDQHSDESGEFFVDGQSRVSREDDSTTAAAGTNKFLIHQRLKATNVGKMKLQIRHFFIDSSPCEGYGFLVKNCQAVQLQPNQSFELELIYSPDFTQTTIKHNLFVLLDDEFTKWQRFELIVNIPPKYLSSCLSALPRPSWEAYVGRCLFIITISLIFLTVFVAYTDANRLVSGPVCPSTDPASKKDKDTCHSEESQTCNAQNGTAEMNGSKLNENAGKAQIGRIRHRKNAKTMTEATAVQLTQQAKKNRLENVAKEVKTVKAVICDEKPEPKLNHQNSSSSENETSGSLSNSESSSSNRQSTESLCDISSNSRKNSVDEPQSNSDKASKEKAHQENGKKKKSKVESKKSNISKQQNQNQSSMQSLVFPPIEEFQTMAKGRSGSQLGRHKAKPEERKKKTGSKTTENARIMPKKAEEANNHAWGDKSNSTNEPVFNMDNWKHLTDIWKQPSDWSGDIGRFPDRTAPEKAENRSSAAKPWNVGEWSNDCARMPTQRIFEQSRHDPTNPGYLGLRFNFKEPSRPSQSTNHNSHIANRDWNPVARDSDRIFQHNRQSAFGHPGFTFNSGSSSLWETKPPAPSPSVRMPTSSATFSPVIAPPKSTSPSNTVQQIEQQDNFFQRRNLQSSPFDNTGIDFPDIINCREPLFMENSHSFPRVAPPPGFGNLPPIEPMGMDLPWLDPIQTEPIGQDFHSDSIWNCFEPKHDGWSNRTASKTNFMESNWPMESGQFSRDPDYWLTTDNQDKLPNSWLAPGTATDRMQAQPSPTLDPLRFSPNPTSPSPSSSSSSNGKNNNC